MRAELLWFLCGNFHIFVTMATGIGLTQISLAQWIGSSQKPLFGARISYTSWVIADFLMKFTDFCYHGNKVRLAKIWMTPLDWPTTKNPHRCKILGSILNASWVNVIFVWKFPHFRYHGNGGWPDTNFTCTVKSAVPQNPYLAQES